MDSGGIGPFPSARLHVSSANATAATTLFLVSSGTAAGQELMVVKGDGKVGIGLTGPSRPLHVVRSDAGTSSQSGTVAMIDNPNSTTNNWVNLGFMGANTSGGSQYYGLLGFQMTDHAVTTEKSDFVLQVNYNQTPTERLRVTSAGNVGVGTTNPVSTMTVAGSFGLNAIGTPPVSPAGTGRIYFDSSANVFKVSENGNAYVNLVGGGSSPWQTVGSLVNLVTGTNNVVVQSTLTVQGNAFSVGGSTFVVSSGQVGIGVTNPASALDINSALQPAVITRKNGNIRSYLGYVSGADAGSVLLYDTTGDSRIALDADPNWKSWIGSDGTNSKLGIGTANPAAALHVSSANASASATVLQISTGTGAGQELVVVKGDGKVGIGTTAPGARLHITGPSGITSFTGTTIGGLFIDGAVANNQYSTIDFKEWSTGNPAVRIGARITASGSLLSFGTTPTYASGVTNTAMTIDPNGNVGIATTNPVSTMTVAGSLGLNAIAAPPVAPVGTGRIYFDSGTNKFRVSENTGGYVDLIGGGSSPWQAVGSLVNLVTGTNNVVVQSTLTVQGNAFSVGGSTFVVNQGNVGVGTTGPTNPLHVVATAPALFQRSATGSNSPAIRFYNPDTTANNATGAGFATDTTGAGATTNIALADLQALFVDHNHATRKGDLVFRTDGGSGLTEQMRVNNAGNVGIGVTAPAARLHLSSGTVWIDGDAANSFRIGISSMIVTSAGSVGIGTTNPLGSSILHMAKNGFPTVVLDRTDASTYLELLAGSVSQGLVYSNIFAIGKDTYANRGASAGGTNYFQIDQNGRVDVLSNTFAVGSSTLVVANGQVGIGTTNPLGKLDVRSPADSSTALYINKPVLDATNRDAIYLFENDGQSSGKQSISWFNGNQNYYKARLWTEVGGGYAATVFGIDTADDARNVATRLAIRNGNVGIGPTNPSTVLHVSAATEPVRAQISGAIPASTWISALTLQGNPGASNAQWGARFWDGSADVARIGAEYISGGYNLNLGTLGGTGANGMGRIVFKTLGNERAYIDQNGWLNFSNAAVGIRWQDGSTSTTSRLQSASNCLGSAVTVATANTWYDGPSVSLGAGTWFVSGQILMSGGGGPNSRNARLWDGSTDYATGQATSGSYNASIPVSAIINLTGTTTIKISGTSDGTAAQILTAIANPAAGGNVASCLYAFKIGG